MRGLDGQWHAEAHGTAQGRLKEEDEEQEEEEEEEEEGLLSNNE